MLCYLKEMSLRLFLPRSKVSLTVASLNLKIEKLIRNTFSELLFPLLERWRNNGLMEAADGVYKLTPMGLFWQNQLNRAVMIAVQYLVYGPRVAGRKSALTMMSAMENRT